MSPYEPHEGQLRFGFIRGEALDTLDQEVVLEDEEKGEQVEQAGHRELVEEVDWGQLGEEELVWKEENEVPDMGEDWDGGVEEDVEEHCQISEGPVASVHIAYFEPI